MCVCMYKSIFLSIGSFGYKPVAYRAPLLFEMMNGVVNVSSSSAWVRSPAVFPEEGETLPFQPAELGASAALVASPG